MLHATTWGAGPALALVHGFTQSGAAWGPVAEAAARHHTVIALDAPGHGRSAGVRADLPGGADLLAATVGGPAAWLGYSMGGRYALHVALRHPGAVTRLVVVSATGGIDDPAERAARRRADEGLADRVEAEGLEPFVRWWVERPLFATLSAADAAIDARLGGTAEGLASSLREAGAGTQEPLWDALGALTMPVLVVAGERDPAYLAHGERLAAAVGPNASFVVVPGAGHACHLEAPGPFLERVLPFLDPTAGGRPGGT